MGVAEIKTAISRDIESRATELGEISRKIHDNPETAMEERKASGWLVKYLKENGFKIETGIYKLPTAFRAKYGKGKPVIGFLAEYDALPRLGHACGHNLIATSSVAAATAARLAVDKFGGSIFVYGTPGEEGDAGKALMEARGAFRDLDMAMICHPGGGNQVITNALACQTLEVEFFGKAAHAAADPEAGINALEAMILSFNNIDALRQHIKETARIHGIITDGGEASNIVPSHTAGSFIVRADNDDYLETLKEKVINCFTGAAIATGAELKYRWAEVKYAVMRNNMVLARLFRKNMQSLGYRIPLGEGGKWAGSTDVGNVSHLAPTIQPMVGIAPDDVLIHSVPFAEAAATKKALAIMFDAARAMAMTAADILAGPEIFTAVCNEFRKNN